jgi:hypothetical protein
MNVRTVFIAAGYRLDGRRFISSRGKRVLFSPQWPDEL